ncbi:MAG: hypothetical protein ACKVOW_10795, partial [Chitinophagaceae bacterium]
TYIKDPFFINKYTFSKTTEAVPINWQAWNWGDGSAPVGGNNPVHIFDSAKSYNVCYSVKPTSGNCTTTVCKNIVVNLVNGCDSRLTMTNLGEPTAFLFSSLPFANPSKKRHTWIFDNSYTLVSNSQDYVQKQYSAKGTEYEWLGQPYQTFRYSLNPDSQFRKLRHVVYDSLTGCESFYDTSFKLSARIPKLSITYVRHPIVPNYVTFFAQDTINGGPVPFYPRIWKIEAWIGGYGGIQYGPNSTTLNYAVSHTFPSLGIYRVALMPLLPNENMGRQDIYETFINIDSVSPCPELLDFSYYTNASNNLSVVFTPYIQPFGISGSGNSQWIFGNGDSTSILNGGIYGSTFYEYSGIGAYNVCLRYYSPGGCLKQVCKTVVLNNVVDTIISPGNSMNLSARIQGNSYQWQINTENGYTNISDNAIYQGTNNFQMRIFQPPTSFYNNKYRCFVTRINDTIYNVEYVLKFQTQWWGISNSEWNNASNWSTGRVPDENTDVIISPGALNFPEVNSNSSVRSLTIKPGAVVTVKNGFVITIRK